MKPPTIVSVKTPHPLPPTAGRSRARILSRARSRAGTAKACAMLLAASILIPWAGPVQAGPLREDNFPGTACRPG